MESSISQAEFTLTQLAASNQQQEDPIEDLCQNQDNGSTLDLKQECWIPCADFPPSEWKNAVKQLDKILRRAFPEQANLISLWFLPLQPEEIEQWGDLIRLRFPCTSQRRHEALAGMRPTLEALLHEYLFPGRQVRIELTARYEQPAQHLPQTPGDIDLQEDAGLPNEPTLTLTNQVENPSLPPTPSFPADSTQLDLLRKRLGISMADDDLRAVLAALQKSAPDAYQVVKDEIAGNEPPSKQPLKERTKPKKPISVVPIADILLEPSYASSYDSIIRDHSAIYMPAYFLRHLRHMGAADGLRFMALRQIAYLRGMKDLSGSRMLLTSAKEISQWSALSGKYTTGGLEKRDSYLYLLAGKVPYIDYYKSRPESTRWEDAAGYHWKANGREYCVWKKNGDCSQLIPDRTTGEPQWRQAPMVYRVQLSMPLCPEDEQALRAALIAYGVKDDPIGAIQHCLTLSRDELIPDRPQKVSPLPRKLYTVEELVMETWSHPGSADTARVIVQAKILETHLVPPRELLKIPYYLIEKWGPYLSPAQIWTVIALMDRVFSKQGEYRDITRVRGGLKEILLMTEDEYSRGSARKVGKWLAPFGEDETFNPWFSVFASETGERFKNPDNSIGLTLRVLPIVPLCPEDTLVFVNEMGLNRLAVRDCSGNLLAVEITAEEVAVYLPEGRTMRFSHQGDLRYGEETSVQIKALDRSLGGVELFSSDQFFEGEDWPSALFWDLENRSSALFSGLENGPSVNSSGLESRSSALSSDLENRSSALFYDLDLNPSALFSGLLKLLILNLYGSKINSSELKPPSSETQPENVDALELFGSRQGQYVQWMGVTETTNWEFESLVRSLGINDVQGLLNQHVNPTSITATALELYAIPAHKFTTGRVSVLVAKLRSHPVRPPDTFSRLADLGPLVLQGYLRRAIINVTTHLNDPDWDSAMGQARRDDLIELSEKLGLARVFRTRD